MADAFAPDPFLPITPVSVRPPPTREELRQFDQYRKTGLPTTNLLKQLYRNWYDSHVWDDQQIWDG